RPAGNRKTAVRYRAGEPASHRQETSMTTIKKPGRLASSDVAQARGYSTRLAESVERRPLKSGGRGSSPRSCPNLIGLRRICSGEPVVCGSRRVGFPCRPPVSPTLVTKQPRKEVCHDDDRASCARAQRRLPADELFPALAAVVARRHQ